MDSTWTSGAERAAAPRTGPGPWRREGRFGRGTGAARTADVAAERHGEAVRGGSAAVVKPRSGTSADHAIGWF